MRYKREVSEGEGNSLSCSWADSSDLLEAGQKINWCDDGSVDNDIDFI